MVNSFFFNTYFFFNISFSIFSGLDPEYTYDFRVVAVDGDHETPSETIPVYTYPGPGKGGLNQQPMATSGWFIFIYLFFLRGALWQYGLWSLQTGGTKLEIIDF